MRVRKARDEIRADLVYSPFHARPEAAATAAMQSTPLSLLERLRHESDQDSWSDFVALYTPLIRRWVDRGVPSTADAEDLTQEVLMVIVRELPTFEHSRRPGAFRSWVRTITAHRLKTYWRNRLTGKDPASLLEAEQLEDPSSNLTLQWDRDHDHHVARQLLARIEPEFSPATWRSFRRQVLDGASAAEVASESGLSVNAVLIAKSRVLRRLRHESRGLLDGGPTSGSTIRG